jgi:hypothetical protein
MSMLSWAAILVTVEQGKHEKLLAKKGFYAELYNSQFEAAQASY